MKGSCLFAGMLLLCLSQAVTWVYGQDNLAYTKVGWQEPNIRILDRNLEFTIGAHFVVNLDSIPSNLRDVRVRIFRGNRKTLSSRRPVNNENCVTFHSVVFDIERSMNGHIKLTWGRGTDLTFNSKWLKLWNNNEGDEELMGENYFFKFEFRDNQIPKGYLRIYKHDIENYFRTGSPMTIVPRLVGSESKPDRKKIEEWISEIRKWREGSDERRRTPDVCIQFVKSQIQESLKVAKTFKCHELKA